jgi:hypothetical protein
MRVLTIVDPQGEEFVVDENFQSLGISTWKKSPLLEKPMLLASLFTQIMMCL